MFVYHFGIPFVALQQAVYDISGKRYDPDGEEGEDLDPHKGKHPEAQFLVVWLLLLVPPGDDSHDDEYDDSGEDRVEKVANAECVRSERFWVACQGAYTGKSP